MNNINLMIDSQRKIVFDGLSKAFPFNSTLNYLHSLADCDFYDSNRCFPEDWVERCGINLADAIPQYWYDDDRKLAVEQATFKKISMKDYHWSSVKAEYLDRYQSGFFYMKIDEFKFYLCAWMYKYCSSLEVQDELNVLSGISDRFLSAFSGNFVGSKDPWWLSLDLFQIELIINFLVYLSIAGIKDGFKAESCLGGGWLDYSENAVELLQRFKTEKMIQDFIDKG
jgi:hypothetical protein